MIVEVPVAIAPYPLHPDGNVPDDGQTVRLVLGNSKAGWLKALFASARISKLIPSVKWNVLPSPRLTCSNARAGQLIPALVAESSRGWDSKRSLIEPLVRTAVLQFGVADNVGKPLKVVTSQRVRVCAARHDWLKGWPSEDDVVPASCHPPITASSRVLLFRNCRPLPNGNS